MNRKEWKRKCLNPQKNQNCKEILEYKTKHNLNQAIKKDTLCNSCSKFNKNHPFWGKKRPEHSEKISKKYVGKNNPMYGKSFYNMWVEKYGKKEADKKLKTYIKNISGENNSNFGRKHFGINNGENNPMYGQSVYDVWVKKYGKEDADIRQKEVNKKIRLSNIKNIKNKIGQILPNYNPNAIFIILQKAKKLDINDLQHAETSGGEYYIKELGYWVDGYSKEKNIVIEYYENWHRKTKNKKRDEKRKQEIIGFLDCEFIEIKEWEI